MGVVTAARALGRLQYRLARIPFDLFEDTVMPVLFDNEAPARLAYEWVLIECDNPAAVQFDDDSAAAHAQLLRWRGDVLKIRRLPPSYYFPGSAVWLRGKGSPIDFRLGLSGGGDFQRTVRVARPGGPRCHDGRVVAGGR